MKNRSLVSQFRITFTFIILSSIVVSLITYGVILLLFVNALNQNRVYPENHYERQIPDVKSYVKNAGSSVLSVESEKELQQFIQGEEFYYQVSDIKMNILYGTYQQQIFDTQEQIYERMNTTFTSTNYYVHVIPVINTDGIVEGAVSLIYKLDVSAVNNGNPWITVAFIAILTAPFLCFILFTLLYSRILAKNISRPLQILADASHQIKEKNLDFEIEYHSANELGALCNAFTEMKEELKTALSTQWKLEQERVELVESLAHDLKSPLSIVKVYSEALIDDTQIDEEQKQYLTVIEENIETSISLVQQMQYTSDLDHSSVAFTPSSVNVAEFLDRKIAHYELQARKKEISIRLNLETSLPASVLTDADKLERILDNIVSNSLQYTPSNGTIELSVKAQDNFLYYSICDTGVGFTAKDIEKAFDKFYRGDNARQTKGGHSGLGLHIAKHLAELLGGDMRIQNGELGGGCVVFWHGV